MDLTFTLVRTDYAKAQKYVARRMFRGSPWRLVALGLNLLVGLLFGMGFMLIYRSAERLPDSIQPTLMAGLVLTAVSLIASTLSAYVAAAAGRRVMLRAGGAVLSPQSFSATDNGLVQRCRLSESRTSWSDIEAVEEDSDYLYFFHDRGVATIIPRRVFPTRTAYNEFVALVRSYVAPSEIKGG